MPKDPSAPTSSQNVELGQLIKVDWINLSNGTSSVYHSVGWVHSINGNELTLIWCYSGHLNYGDTSTLRTQNVPWGGVIQIQVLEP